MGTVIDKTIPKDIPGKLPIFVELLGPAGTGKTTLLYALNKRNKDCIIGTRLRTRNINHFWHIARSTGSLLPTLIGHYLEKRTLTRQEIVMMAVLDCWHRVLTHQASQNTKVILIDQGPVFKLAWLEDFSHDDIRGIYFDKWWGKSLEEWASKLDVVIYLDAPDQVLLGRIDSRDKAHLVKGKSDYQVIKFLEQCRESFTQVISIMKSNSESLCVLHFNTAQEPPDQIADRILTSLAI